MDPKNTIHRRRYLREKTLQTLYAYEVSKEPIAIVVEQQLAELQSTPVDYRFVTSLIEHIVQHEEELDAIIKSRVANWEFERVAIIDRIILRIGISEMMYFTDIPPKVTINEAIEIAKSFSTEKSGTFINGVLDAVLQDLKSSKTLNKSGRGLINTDSPQKEKNSDKGEQ